MRTLLGPIRRVCALARLRRMLLVAACLLAVGTGVAALAAPPVPTATESAALSETRGREACDFMVASGNTAWISIVVYFVVMLAFRWNMIAKPTLRIYRTMIAAEAADVEAFFVTNTQSEAKIALLNYQKSELASMVARLKKSHLTDMVFWNRGRELSGILGLHSLRQQRLLLLSDQDDIENRLKTFRARLLAIADDTLAKDFADRIGKDRQNGIDGGRKYLLVDVAAFLDDRDDSSFSTLAGWQNKTFWFSVAALLLIDGLSYTVGYEYLFLMGATGGLLSRLTYSLYRNNVPTDYGASWTKIFLSPVVGALTGWGGVMLLHLAYKMGILGSAFSLDWCKPNSFICSIAIVMGFSERLFTGILSQLEDKLAKSPDGAATKPPLTAPGGKGSTSEKDESDDREERVRNEQAAPTTVKHDGASNNVQPALSITTDRIRELDASHRIDAQLAASGGKPDYAFTADMPAGLSMDKRGRITGILKEPGTFNVDVTVTDADNNSVHKRILLGGRE